MPKEQIGNIKDYLLPYEKQVLYDGVTNGIISVGEDGILVDSILNYDSIVVQGCMYRNDLFCVTESHISNIIPRRNIESLSNDLSTYKFDCYQCVLVVPNGGENRIQFAFQNETTIRLVYVTEASSWKVGIRNVIGIRRSSSLESKYCFEEKIIGKWVNGENIYRVTIPNISVPDDKTIVDLSQYNVKEIVNFSGSIIAKESNGVTYNYPIPYMYSLAETPQHHITCYYGVDTKTLIIKRGTGVYTDMRANLTIEYIKN